MSDVRVLAATTPTRATTDGGYIGARALRDGTQVLAPWLEALSLEGRVFQATNAVVTTPLAFGGSTTIVTTVPCLTHIIPSSGFIVLPIEVDIYFEAYGSSAQAECMVAVGTGGVVGTGGAAIVPTCLRSDAPLGVSYGVASMRGADTGATYFTTNVSELMHDGAQFAISKTAGSATASAQDPNRFTWRRQTLGTGPVLGPATGSGLMVFAASQAPTGFVRYTYAVLPSNSVV